MASEAFWGKGLKLTGEYTPDLIGKACIFRVTPPIWDEGKEVTDLSGRTHIAAHLLPPTHIGEYTPERIGKACFCCSVRLNGLHPPTIPHLPPPLHLSAAGLLTVFSHPHPLTALHKETSAAATPTPLNYMEQTWEMCRGFCIIIIVIILMCSLPVKPGSELRPVLQNSSESLEHIPLGWGVSENAGSTELGPPTEMLDVQHVAYSHSYMFVHIIRKVIIFHIHLL